MSFNQSFVEIDGCRTNLRRGGSGEPLLFLHGASGAPAIMPVMEKLAQGFDVAKTVFRCLCGSGIPGVTYGLEGDDRMRGRTRWFSSTPTMSPISSSISSPN